MEEQGFWQFISDQHEKLFTQVLQHLGLTFISLLFAIAIGVPLGILIVRRKGFSKPVLGLAGVLQTIPSIALLGFMIPALGIGAKPAIVALLIYALLPIIRNTFTGIVGVSLDTTEAARALGMSKSQILFKVELPLALPVIIAGIRTAAVINVGVATLASFVAAGGLGEFIFGGISLNNTNMILAGAIPAALMAIVLDTVIAGLQRLSYRAFKKVLFVTVIILVIPCLWFFIPRSNSKLVAAFTPEFMGRQDGDLGLRSVYGLHMNPTIVSDAIMYKAVYEGELDVISGYSTDGRIKAYNLTVLDDDKKIFPPYQAAPIMKFTTLQKFPDLEETLNLLAGRITDSVMTNLNYKTDYLNQTPEKVAKDFLISAGIYKEPRGGHDGTVRIGSKIFGEQYILVELYRIIVEGYTNYKVQTKTGLGGTKICFDALMNDGIDFYPEYTGTGLLVLLNPSPEVVKRATADSKSTYNYVSTEFQNKYRLKWLMPLGFNNTYALMMREQQASTLKIKTISDLKSCMKDN
ncbi:ABC transporter permease [Sphingobacteriaceae bacterium]|nr:ABC transporter permease [Sphingobacteriaceae bacterium]